MTPDKDGWINHDGGPCPVAPGRLVMVNGGIDCAIPVESVVWKDVTKYRTFARVNPPDPGPSPFVRDAAARIMAQLMSDGSTRLSDNDMARCAVAAALALEAALKGVKP